MPIRLRSRRTYLAAVALSAVVLTACSGATSSSSPSAGVTATPAAARQATDSRPAEAAKPAAPAVAATSVPKPAAAAPPANRPADADAAARASGVAAPAAAAAPPRPAAPQQPAAAQAAPVPPPAPTPAKPADPAAVVPAQMGRMVIYTTEVSVLVASPTQLVSALGDVVTQNGGYLAGVENKEEGGVPVTTIRLKIPPDRYEPAMRQIRGLAVEVTSEKATTQDVTEEFSDVQSQLRSLEASHAQLLELMSKAQNVEEILKIQEKLAQTKLQIDRLKGRETFLQRSADLATVTIHARPAEEVLARTFSTLRTSLRRAEAQRAQTVKAIQNAKTPEEEATLRDKLGEVTLEVDRLNARLSDVQAKAQTANITLPTPPDDPVTTAGTDQDLLMEYMRLKGEHRAAVAEVDRLTRDERGTPEAREALRLAIARVTTLDTQVKAVEERARRGGVALPNLTPDQIATLAGLPPESVWSRVSPAWALLSGLGVIVVGGLGLLAGRRLLRRPPAGPAPSAA